VNALDVVSESVLVPLAPYVLAIHALLIALLAGLLLGAVLLTALAAICVWVGWEEIVGRDATQRIE
jgi:hypothetical protein